MSNLHTVVAEVTERIRQRSATSRSAYLAMIRSARRNDRYRAHLGCANIAHAYAAMPAADKLVLRQLQAPNIGVITAYNDVLSAHKPYEHYPERLRASARRRGASLQVASGVPAMCDGVTQGYEGMELSLFSRDVIALATAVGLSHNIFDAALLLGICDKIVPGLFIGAAQLGHLPVVFVPAGPMTSGLPNSEKSRIRQLYARGEVSREELLRAEEASYHGPGTCTFYGTANSNQMLVEIMGLQLPGASFVNPDSPLRDPLTDFAVERALDLVAQGITMADMVDERTIVNAIVGLLATGGSTNHTIHLVAMARAVGIVIDWDDFARLSSVVPLLARVYPNGTADVNRFQAVGGMAFLVRELLQAGLLHADVQTIMGHGLQAYTREPVLAGDRLVWRDAPATSADTEVLRPVAAPFSADGGLKLLQGNLGRAVVKVSAVAPAHRRVQAPAVVCDSQAALIERYQRGELERDFVAVVRFQGPQANGMPELHKLTPILGVLQDKGYRVALVTDGRMSGASGKVPAAIHLCPEAAGGGPIARLRDGDLITLDCDAGLLHAAVSDEEWQARTPATHTPQPGDGTLGRALFALLRRHVSPAEQGASAFLGEV
jgi:phosphogluconate dehydratase